MEAYIAQYGYIGIFIGTFLEGETTVLLGGIFAKLNYMDLKKVMFCAFLGTFIGDLSFFFLGRVVGRNYIERYDFLRTRAALADRIIRKHGHLIIFAIRFLVGIRSVVLLLLGCTGIRMGKFLFLDLVNSIFWSLFVSSAGYLFANVVYVFVYDIKKYEHLVVPLILVPVFVGIYVYRRMMKEKEKAYGDQ